MKARKEAMQAADEDPAIETVENWADDAIQEDARRGDNRVSDFQLRLEPEYARRDPGAARGRRDKGKDIVHLD